MRLTSGLPVHHMVIPLRPATTQAQGGSGREISGATSIGSTGRRGMVAEPMAQSCLGRKLVAARRLELRT